jgi:hypothetical protein
MMVDDDVDDDWYRHEGVVTSGTWNEILLANIVI